MNEFLVDGALLESGNPNKVKAFARIAANRLAVLRSRASVGHDDALDHLENALRRIEKGEPPNDAFGWSSSKGRPAANFALRNWEIRRLVQDRMKSHDESLTAACGAVSDEAGGEVLLGYDAIREICRGLKRDVEEEMPNDIYPIDPTPYLRG